MIRKDNGSNNSLFLSCQMGLSDGAFFMIKHTPLPNVNHPILSPVCPMGVADTLRPWLHSTNVDSMVKYKNLDVFYVIQWMTWCIQPYNLYRNFKSIPQKLFDNNIILVTLIVCFLTLVFINCFNSYSTQFQSKN